MGIYAIRVPDIGEGVAEAELVEWLVEVGQEVAEDQILAAVMTDKATVEIPSSRAGTVVRLGAAIGDTVAIGSELVRLEVEGEGNVGAAEAAPAPGAGAKPEPEPESKPEPKTEPKPEPEPQRAPASAAAGATSSPPPARPGKPLASPAVRRRALDLGIDLRLVRGSGPAGRILHEDLDAVREPPPAARGAARGRAPDESVTETRVVGMRRKIAERMSVSYREIPHITIVEEVDVTALEDLRATLNAEHGSARGKLTILPFLMRALVDACRRQPALNAHFDAENGVLRAFGGLHVGIATQTPAGLVVPVVRHVETLDVWACAASVARLSAAARDGKATREELSGSSITITSLGALGALATTPIINHPEVAIVGVNRMAVRPHWDGVRFVPRKMMNLSSSFDHRVIDGWDAALFVQRLKTLLETPALLFVEA